MNPQRAVLLALICGPFLAGVCVSAEGQKGGATQQDPPDEVIIQAQRERLSRLRKELEKTQDAFYEQFNRINTDPEYETHCSLTTRTGSRISQRVCAPKFVDTATEVESQALVRGLQDGHFHWAPPASEVIKEKMPAYRKRVIELARNDPKLGKTARDYLAQTKHYEAVRKQKFKGKWLVWD